MLQLVFQVIYMCFVRVCVHAVAESCPILGDSMDYSLPGYSVHELRSMRSKKSQRRLRD